MKVLVCAAQQNNALSHVCPDDQKFLPNAMKIIKLNWSEAENKSILDLKDGELCFPDLSYTEAIEPLTPSTRLSQSIRAMCSNLEESRFFKIAQRIGCGNEREALADSAIAAKIRDLEESIKSQIKEIASEGTYPKDGVEEVFHLIQLWGGNTGRNIYVKKNGFEENWSFEAYQQIAKICTACKSQELPQVLKCLEEQMEHIEHWGLAFASKHYSFWNRNCETPRLAIFDSILCKGLFGKKTPNFKLYIKYLAALSKFADEHRIQIHNVERSLFNYFNSNHGVVWIALRMRRSEE